MKSRAFQVIACTLALFGARIGRASDAYIEEMIACPEAEETMVSRAYDAFLGALERGQIRKEDLRLPVRLTERRDDHVIFSRSFYVSPNELRGFELVIPASLLAEEDGIFNLLADLSVASQNVRQRVTILVMKNAEANQRRGNAWDAPRKTGGTLANLRSPPSASRVAVRQSNDMAVPSLSLVVLRVPDLEVAASFYSNSRSPGSIEHR